MLFHTVYFHLSFGFVSCHVFAATSSNSVSECVCTVVAGWLHSVLGRRTRALLLEFGSNRSSRLTNPIYAHIELILMEQRILPFSDSVF